MSIGTKIKEQRMIHNLTQPELATKLDMSLDSVKKLETDRVKPSLETLEKLADIFNCSADYLLGRTGSSFSTPEVAKIIQNIAKEYNIDLNNPEDTKRFRNAIRTILEIQSKLEK